MERSAYAPTGERAVLEVGAARSSYRKGHAAPANVPRRCGAMVIVSRTLSLNRSKGQRVRWCEASWVRGRRAPGPRGVGRANSGRGRLDYAAEQARVHCGGGGRGVERARRGRAADRREDSDPARCASLRWAPSGRAAEEGYRVM